MAPRLIGWRLLSHGVEARITETEAYQSESDRACHAWRGRTRRTAALYAAPGTLYIYRCYGVHWMLNLVCDRVDEPAAVLIRAVEVVSGQRRARGRRGLAGAGADALTDPRTLANGPGKVCQVLALDGSAHGSHLGDPGCVLALAPPLEPAPPLSRGARVGVDYAGPRWSRRRWRWWERGFPVAR